MSQHNQTIGGKTRPAADRPPIERTPASVPCECGNIIQATLRKGLNRGVLRCNKCKREYPLLVKLSENGTVISFKGKPETWIPDET